MTHPRGGPTQSLFEGAEGVLQVEAPDVRPPEETEIGFSLTMPPQPHNLRFSPPLGAGQPLDLYQNQRASHDGQRPAATTAFVCPPGPWDASSRSEERRVGKECRSR